MLLKQEPNKYIPTFAQFIDFIEPVLLTEEWLLKFGFEKANDSWFKKTFVCWCG